MLSIVTAIKDGLEYFKQTADSILKQTYLDWEWIIVDDHSEEDIAGYVKGFRDKRIRYVRNEAPLGQTRSLNVGIQLAKSDWIIRMDGDDLAHPSRLAEIQKAVEASTEKIPLIFSDYDVVDELGAVIDTVEYAHPISAGFYFYLRKMNNPLCHPTVAFYKKNPRGDLYLYDVSLENAQDYELWKRILKDYGQTFVHVPKSLLQYRLVKTSLSGARAREQTQELSKIRDEMPEEVSEDIPIRPSAKLNPREQEGMHAYRMLYYRFLGSGTKNFFPRIEDLYLLKQTLKYTPIAKKAGFFFLMKPLNQVLKRTLFYGIYK